MNSAPLLSARSVAKSFDGVPALRNGCFELRAGSVHALCGGNGAGKSTFLNILMGVLSRDSGSVQVSGREVNFSGPHEALRARMSIITQELAPIPGMTVAENIFLGREPRRLSVMVDRASLRQQAAALLRRLEFDLDPDSLMHRLSLAQCQLVEIARAFSCDSRIIIMDEPTSAIGEHETDTLFRAIRSATAQGAGIIYVSHRLAEIFSIADTYTVFRDGAFVDSGLIQDIDRHRLVRQIVGGELAASGRDRRDREPGGLLQVRGLSRRGEFEHISLSVAPGEALGIYGLMGSGRSEFLNCIFGITSPHAGQVTLSNRPLPPGNPRASIRRGLSLVTEDRKASGLIPTGSVASNVSLAALPKLATASVVNRHAERVLVESMMQRLRIRAASPSMRVTALSGGNQQKVVLARCMSTQPVCLLCDEPTRGIDEGAKREVHNLLDEFVRGGGASIVVSSEAPEVLQVSDRIAIFKKGRLVTVIDGHSATQDELLHLSS